jgi:hypothetical protein
VPGVINRETSRAAIVPFARAVCFDATNCERDAERSIEGEFPKTEI